jgi:hypothetical protein
MTFPKTFGNQAFDWAIQQVFTVVTEESLQLGVDLSDAAFGVDDGDCIGQSFEERLTQCLILGQRFAGLLGSGSVPEHFERAGIRMCNHVPESRVQTAISWSLHLPLAGCELLLPMA